MASGSLPRSSPTSAPAEKARPAPAKTTQALSSTSVPTSALAYLELVMILPAFGYAAIAARFRGGAALRAAVNGASIAAGLLILTPYALFLVALDLAAAAPVAAVRETSIVVATALGALVLKERVRRRRWAGALLVAAGVALVAV